MPEVNLSWKCPPRSNPTLTSMPCKISLICCTFSDGDSDVIGKGDGIEQSLHQAGYEEFQFERPSVFALISRNA